MAKINHDKFITDMIRYASSAESPEHILAQLLQYIGENLNSDRAYIFEANLDGTFDNTYEWCREGVSPQIDNLKNVPYEGVLDTWFLEYEKRRNILIYDIEEYKSISENMYHVLKAQGIHTLVTGPIEINGKYIGLYGVDNPPKEFIKDISVLIEMMEFVISMIIRLRDYSNALEESAIRDQLTHCQNRTALHWAYDDDMDMNQSIAVIMCDLNGLKKINDSLGHPAGDKYICDAAEILVSCFDDQNVYRVGGDEFIIVLQGITKADLTIRTDRLQLYADLKKISLSFGVSYRTNSKEHFETLLREADKKMYVQKKHYYENLSLSRE